MALNNPYAHYYDGEDDATTITLQNSFINDPSLTGQMTVEFHANILGGGYILASGGEHADTRGLYVTTGGSLYLLDGSRRWRILGAEMPHNETHHYAMVWDGDTLKWLVDGVVTNEAGAIGNYRPGIASVFCIGRVTQKAAYYGEFYMDELRIWDHARTQAQIQENMYKTLTGTETGLELYLRFDTGSGSIAVDSSPNGYHGEITGATWVPGLVDLEEDEPSQGQKVTGAITFRGRSSMSLAGVKRATGSIAFRGQSSMFLSAVKTAVGKITFRGGSFMSLVGLVLRELEGVYQISSSEIVSRNQPVLSTDLANYIEVWINPRVPADQAEEVYRSKEPEPIPPGESKAFNLKLDKEPVIEAVASLEGAGANLSITDTKFYSGSAEITVKNSGASEQTCIIVVQARPLELQGRRKIVVKDEESILDHGLVKYTFDSPLVQDEASARDIGKKILWLFSVARANIEIEWRGDPALELADPVQIPEFEKLGVSKKENFYVVRQLLEVVEGGLDATLSGRKIPRLKEGD